MEFCKEFGEKGGGMFGNNDGVKESGTEKQRLPSWYSRGVNKTLDFF